MNQAKLRDWLEIVAIFSVVASLIFVGLQMRQAHEISLSQAYHARTATAADWHTAFASNLTATSGYLKAIEGSEDDITAEEYESLRRMIIAVLYLFDNGYYQFQEGFVSEEFWITTRKSLKRLMGNSVINAIILDRLNVQGRPEFQAVIRTVDEELRERADD